jgi:hypothetical protein
MKAMIINQGQIYPPRQSSIVAGNQDSGRFSSQKPMVFMPESKNLKGSSSVLSKQHLPPVQSNLLNRES